MKFQSKLTIIAAGTLLLAFIGLLQTGCSQQSMAKHWGGTTTEELPTGQKLIGATWEQNDLWYVLRPMHDEEVAETITLHESSSFGMLQGTIIVHEHAR